MSYSNHSLEYIAKDSARKPFLWGISDLSDSGFGRRLYDARNDASRPGARVTQGAVGKAVGVTGVAVGAWEKGDAEPSLAVIERIAAFLGVSPAWLAWGERFDQAPPADPPASSEDQPVEGTRGITGVVPATQLPEPGKGGTSKKRRANG